MKKMEMEDEKNVRRGGRWSHHVSSPRFFFSHPQLIFIYEELEKNQKEREKVKRERGWNEMKVDQANVVAT